MRMEKEIKEVNSKRIEPDETGNKINGKEIVEAMQ